VRDRARAGGTSPQYDVATPSVNWWHPCARPSAAFSARQTPHVDSWSTHVKRSDALAPAHWPGNAVAIDTPAHFRAARFPRRVASAVMALSPVDA
jgi:hypothetical protein